MTVLDLIGNLKELVESSDFINLGRNPFDLGTKTAEAVSQRRDGRVYEFKIGQGKWNGSRGVDKADAGVNLGQSIDGVPCIITHSCVPSGVPGVH